MDSWRYPPNTGQQVRGQGNEGIELLAARNGSLLVGAAVDVGVNTQSQSPAASSHSPRGISPSSSPSSPLASSLSLSLGSRKKPPAAPPRKAFLAQAYPLTPPLPPRNQVTSATRTLQREDSPPLISPPPLPPRLSAPQSLPPGSDTFARCVESAPRRPPPPPPQAGLTSPIRPPHSTIPPDPPPSTRLTPKTNRLCTECSKVDFAQFTPTALPSNSSAQVHLIDLKHLLTKRNTCNFCSFLFRALCIPSHDPLRADAELQASVLTDPKFRELASAHSQPQIQSQDDVSLQQQQLQQQQEVSFGTWAANRERIRIKPEAKWPFGHSYDKVNLKQLESTSQTEIGTEREVDFGEEEGNDRFRTIAVSEGAKAGLAAGKHFDRDGERARFYGWAMEVVPDIGVINAMTKKRVPAAVRVVVYGAEDRLRSGVLDVKVFGCARSRGREIKTLSHFHAQVASPIPSPRRAGGESPEWLRYGRILDISGIDLNLCRRWVAHCCSTHGEICEAPKWSTALEKPGVGIRLRLIDVVENSVVESDAGRQEYAALSYVWGDLIHRSGIVALSIGNQRAFSVPGALAHCNVGRTISDAMEVVRRLGMRYLWADRLCIVQDCDTDKAAQISQMDRVYGSAVVTIVAASGPHLDSPIGGVTTSRAVTQLAERVTSDPPVNVLLPIQNGTDYPMFLYPWAGRAWTLQEKLLSRRLLIFHDGTVDYQCAHGTMHEDMSAIDAGSRLPPVGWLALADNTSLFSHLQLQPPSINPGPRLLRSSVFKDYTALIEEYTSRVMSNPADAVNAVKGLLKILFGNQPLLHGLPEALFDQALHWQVAAREGVRLRLRPDRRFPSWSWAAWEADTETVREAGAGREESVSVGNTTGPFRISGGVQYEPTFKVQTDSWGRLRKVLHRNDSHAAPNQQPQERFRPLLRWYIADTERGRGVQLRPLNSSGLGFALSPTTDIAQWLAATSTPGLPNAISRPPPRLSPSLGRILRPGHHLFFHTLSARLPLAPSAHLRNETLWAERRKRQDLKADKKNENLAIHREFKINETAILDPGGSASRSGSGTGEEIGRVVLSAPGKRHEQDRGCYGDFILLSECQYFGDEESIEMGGCYPLFNVMMVKWVGNDDETHERDPSKPRIAERIALGKVTKEGWWKSGWREQAVILQ